MLQSLSEAHKAELTSIFDAALREKMAELEQAVLERDKATGLHQVERDGLRRELAELQHALQVRRAPPPVGLKAKLGPLHVRRGQLRLRPRDNKVSSRVIEQAGAEFAWLMS